MIPRWLAALGAIGTPNAPSVVRKRGADLAPLLRRHSRGASAQLECPPAMRIRCEKLRVGALPSFHRSRVIRPTLVARSRLCLWIERSPASNYRASSVRVSATPSGRLSAIVLGVPGILFAHFPSLTDGVLFVPVTLLRKQRVALGGVHPALLLSLTLAFFFHPLRVASIQRVCRTSLLSCTFGAAGIACAGSPFVPMAATQARLRWHSRRVIQYGSPSFQL